MVVNQDSYVLVLNGAVRLGQRAAEFTGGGCSNTSNQLHYSEQAHQGNAVVVEEGSRKMTVGIHSHILQNLQSLSTLHLAQI